MLSAQLLSRASLRLLGRAVVATTTGRRGETDQQCHRALRGRTVASKHRASGRRGWESSCLQKPTQRPVSREVLQPGSQGATPEVRLGQH